MKYMNNLLGIVLIRAYRVQHWKGKQNKTQKKKIDGSAMIANFLYFKNIYIAFSCGKKWQFIGACLISIMKLVYEI
jgi:hypothetical protein